MTANNGLMIDFHREIQRLFERRFDAYRLKVMRPIQRDLDRRDQRLLRALRRKKSGRLLAPAIRQTIRKLAEIDGLREHLAQQCSQIERWAVDGPSPEDFMQRNRWYAQGRIPARRLFEKAGHAKRMRRYFVRPLMEDINDLELRLSQALIAARSHPGGLRQELFDCGCRNLSRARRFLAEICGGTL